MGNKDGNVNPIILWTTSNGIDKEFGTSKAEITLRPAWAKG